MGYWTAGPTDPPIDRPLNRVIIWVDRSIWPIDGHPIGPFGGTSRWTDRKEGATNRDTQPGRSGRWGDKKPWNAIQKVQEI